MSYVQPSMFGEYPDREFSRTPSDEVWIEIRPGWRTVSTRRRNLGWHKIKHRTTLGVVTECGRYGYTYPLAKDPDRIQPCPYCLDIDNAS